MTDGEIREVVNELRAIAKNFSHTQQLREMISSYIVPILQAARATAEQSVPTGWVTQDGATFTLEAAAERGKTPQALAYAAVSRALGGIEKICRNHGYNYAEVLHDWLEAKLSATPADHSVWFAVTSGAAASLEDAAVCMQDPDAKHSAEGAAAFTRKRIKELLSALKSQQDAAIEQSSRDAQADQQQLSLSELQLIKRDTDSRISITFKTSDAADQFILSLVDADVARELRRLENARVPNGDTK